MIPSRLDCPLSLKTPNMGNTGYDKPLRSNTTHDHHNRKDTPMMDEPRPIDPDDLPDHIRSFIETRGNFFQIESFKLDITDGTVSITDEPLVCITLQPYPIQEDAKSLMAERVFANADAAEKLGWALLEASKIMAGD